MNNESINKSTRHVLDVHRIETNLANFTPEEIEKLIEEKKSLYSTRWTLCDRSFRMLFMALNRGNRWPVDSFDIRIKQELDIDTYVRVWRDRRDNTFNVRPFTRNGRIESHEFDKESFGSTYDYSYGTYRSHSAKLEVNHDGVEPIIELTRVDGYLVNDPLDKAAIYLSALDNYVSMQIENTEDTLILINQALLDDSLNPEHAVKMRIHHS